MILRTTMATAAICLALLAQEPTSSLDVIPAADPVPESAAADAGNATGDDSQRAESGPKVITTVYAVSTLDPLDVMKTLTALMPGVKASIVQVSNDAKERGKILVVATESQHQEIASLIQKLETQTETPQPLDKPDQTQQIRKFKVSVARIRNNWLEQLDKHQDTAEGLRQLYKDLDVSTLGGTLETVAPALLFPAGRAAVFKTKEITGLTALLTQLELLENLQLVASDAESLPPYSMETFSVPGLSESSPAWEKDGPFAKRVGLWSVGVGISPGEQNSVLCDRHHTQFVETQWPTRTESIERKAVGSEHFGNRFKLESGEVAVLRWSATHNSVRSLFSGRLPAGLGGFGEGPAAFGGGLGGLGQAYEEEAVKASQDNSSFPVIIIAYAEDSGPDHDVTPGWSKPLKTAVLEAFRYYERSSKPSPRPTSRAAGSSRSNSARGSRPSSQSATGNKENAKQEEFVVTYALRHIQAVEVSKLVEQLWSPAETGARIIADEPNNSLLVWANDQGHAELKKILQALDVPGQTASLTNGPARQKTDKKSVEMEIGPADTLIMKGSKVNVAAAVQMLKQMSSQQLLDHSKSLQNKAIARAEQYLKDGSAKKSLAALRQTVQEDFDVRQRLQIAEIEFLKARLADLERRVRQKEQLKDLIVERRLESLLIKPANEEKKSSLGPPDDAVTKGFTDFK